MGEAGCLRDGKFQNLHVDGATNILNNVNLAGDLSVGGTIETQDLNLNNVTVTRNLEVPGTINNRITGGIVTYNLSASFNPTWLFADAQISQPAGTFIKDIFIVTNVDLATDSLADNSLEILCGGGRTDTLEYLILGCDNLLGPSEIWPANVPLPIIKDGVGQPAAAFTAFADATITNSTIEVLAPYTTYSTNGRILKFEVLGNNLIPEGRQAATITIIITFMYA